VVGAVSDLQKTQGLHLAINISALEKKLGIHRTTVRRAVNAALAGGWLINGDPKARRYALRTGEPLPDESGLPSPESLETEWRDGASQTSS
jgi:hypothetical protein